MFQTGAVEGLLTGLNAVDYLIILVLALSALIGLRNGFVRGALDLLGLAAAFAVAVIAYRPAADLLAVRLGLPLGVLQVGAFLLLLLLARALLAILESGLLRVARPVVYAIPFARALDRLFGILPGLVRGALIAALVVIPFSILPFFPRLTEVVQQSRIGSRLLREVMVLAPAVEARLGASFDAITPPPGPGEPVELPVRNPLGPRSDAAGEQEMFRLLS